MTKRFRRTLVAAAVGALVCAGPAAAQFSGFTFFGDSLTDAGSYQGAVPGTARFTTNPDLVWAQALGARYGFTIVPANQGGTDWAYGGARIALTPGNPNQTPTALAVPKLLCSLLVAMALTGGMPAAISAGMVSSPPPPAMASMRPRRRRPP